ncbi:DUF5685 family protein [Prescottella subtropica]|uniref:DUF5685 family protein n=1 Tax=Prescottella subtropica TaxID=2545757 RepID=UPI0010F4AF4A|nr:DUF5685 family protein [Prescottella subtropica]
MLGLVHPCSAGLGPELREQWRAHLCGTCLALRSGAGQVARATTNTDAVLLSALVEAQQPETAATRTAGPCPLRKSVRPQVIAPSELSVRLGATASLTLAAAKVDDTVAEQRAGLAPRRRGVGLLAAAGTRWARKARRDHRVADAAGVPQVLDRLAGQAAVESRSTALPEITAPTADAVSAMFAATADLAGVPENRDALADLGRMYGEYAHLQDAVEDLEADRAAGVYNPLDATGTTVEQARERMRHLGRQAADALGRIRMRDDRLVRPLLLGAMAVAMLADGAPGRKKQPKGSSCCDCCEVCDCCDS